MSTTMNSTAAADLRAQLLAIARGWQPDEKPSQAADVFFPAAHIRALALDRPLVIGMRGAGKSFWSAVLNDDHLRTSVRQYVKGYDKLVHVSAIRWDQGGFFSTRLPGSADLTQALNLGMEPQLLWLTLILHELRPVCAQYGIEVDMPDTAGGWAAVLRWAQQHPDSIRYAFQQLNHALAQQDQVVLVIMDALDRMAAQLAQSVECLRGLLQLLLDVRPLKGLRFKVFLREDMTHMPSVLAFPDASKLVNEAVHLDWTREDIYALHWHKLAQGSPPLAQLQQQHPGQSEAALASLLKELAPPYMGSAANKGHVYSWWYKHLADGKNRVSPRTFATSLQEALKESSKPNATHVLVPAGIQQGVRMASQARVVELSEQYFWVPTALKAFNERLTPSSVQEIYGVWNGVGVDGVPTPRLIREACVKKQIFVPWDDADRLTSPSQKLRDTLVALGILVLRDENTRLDMPDIYRLGYKIRKRGGVSPRR